VRAGLNFSVHKCHLFSISEEQWPAVLSNLPPELVGPDGTIIPRSSDWWLRNQARPERRAVYARALKEVEDRFPEGIASPRDVPAAWLPSTGFTKFEPNIVKQAGVDAIKERIVISAQPQLLMCSVGVNFTLTEILRVQHGAFVPQMDPNSDLIKPNHYVYAPGVTTSGLTEWSNVCVVNLSTRIVRPPVRFEDWCERYSEGGALGMVERAAQFGLVLNPDLIKHALLDGMRANDDLSEPVVFAADASNWDLGYGNVMVAARRGGCVRLEKNAAPGFRTFRRKGESYAEMPHGMINYLDRFEPAARAAVETAKAAHYHDCDNGTIIGHSPIHGLKGPEKYRSYVESTRKNVDSGRDETTSGNTTDNLTLNAVLCYILGSDTWFYCACAGDDMVSFTTRFFAIMLRQLYSLNPFGFNYGSGDECKIVRLNPIDCWNADFCSMRLWPVDGRFVWGPMPERNLLRTFFMKDLPRSLEERKFYAAQVAFGLVEFNYVIPLLSNLYCQIAGIHWKDVSKRRSGRLLRDLNEGDWRSMRNATPLPMTDTLRCFQSHYPRLLEWLEAESASGFSHVVSKIEAVGYFVLPAVVTNELFENNHGIHDPNVG